MSLNDQDRKQIINALIRNILHISDKSYQRRIWIEGKGPEWDDFDETAEYFLMEGNGILKNYKQFSLTQDQYLLLKKLWEEFNTYSDDHPYLPEDFIETPEWTRITVMAKEVLLAFGWPNQC